MERAALYVRVSTEDQAEFSPDAQLHALREYAEKNKMIIDDEHIFKDEGISGRRADKRPSFMKMISIAKSKPKPFDVILVHKFDRFSRSKEDSVVYKNLLRKNCKIKVISITEQMEDDKFGIILESMLEAMAEYYSLNLSDEVKKGMTEKARRGELQTPAPFGYRMIDGLLTPHEEEAAFVNEIFHKYVNENMNLRSISQYANALGFKTKRGNNFDKRLIEYIIYNPTYIGKMRWTPTGSVVCNHDFDNPDTMIIDGKHKAIVNEELWEKANQKIRIKVRTRNPYENDGEVNTHWLKGVLRCSECGGTLSFGRAYGTRESAYRCNRYLNGGCEKSQRITISKIEKIVLDTLYNDSELYPQEEFNKIIVNANKNANEEEKIFRQIEKLDAKLKKAKELVLSGIDSDEEYKQNKEDIAKERNRLNKLMQEVKVTKNKDVNIFREKIKSVYDILISKSIDLTKKNSAIKEILNKIVYNKELDQLEFYYYFVE